MKVEISKGLCRRQAYEQFKETGDEIISVLIKSGLSVKDSVELLRSLEDVVPAISSVGHVAGDTDLDIALV